MEVRSSTNLSTKHQYEGMMEVADRTETTAGGGTGVGISSTKETRTPGNKTKKLRKFILDTKLIHVQLQAVIRHEPHRAFYGKKDEAFKKVRDTVI